MKANTVEKTYLAIVCGAVESDSGTIDAPIDRDPDSPHVRIVTPQGYRAVTHYETVERYGAIASLVRLRLETGRTHQIRVHMNHIGHPLLGDVMYGVEGKADDKDHELADERIDDKVHERADERASESASASASASASERPEARRVSISMGPNAPEAIVSLDRHALHAARLAFAHPASGSLAEFEAPLPEDLAAVVDRLRRASLA